MNFNGITSVVVLFDIRKNYLKNLIIMRSVKLFFAVIAALAVSYSASAQLPSVKLENRKGEVVNTSSLVDGKTPMIISFWAVTCKPVFRSLMLLMTQCQIGLMRHLSAL